ncbi:DUF1302 family protein [Oleomonas cavernae]|uniref:DUF1302 family protein n=1 Tax=Oleomonas cavernae TaxID=2320859 RepID=A0A418W920_9PROT|nr:DUF1302 family protein [Oleomonas cavernae]RJF86502.1 DUF1302 family protein [Oleomonas cavernae]
MAKNRAAVGQRGGLTEAGRLALRAALAGSILGAATSALSEVYEFDNGATLSVGLTTTYQVGIRAEDPNPRSFSPETDQITVRLLEPVPLLPAVTTSILVPRTYNFDDPNLNFEKGDLITNAASALLEAEFKYQDYGLSFSGNGFYDLVYHQSNSNDTVFPDGINKKSGEPDEFMGGTRYANGGRFRLLNLFAYGNFEVFDTDLSVRVGNQVVAWGESLFFGNIAISQGVVDVTRANTPGAEVKDILLPQPQISMNWGVTPRLSVVGYYQPMYEFNQLDGPGAYFSRSDIVGPGAEFAYGAKNPFPDIIAQLASACTLSAAIPSCDQLGLPIQAAQILSDILSYNALGIADADYHRFDVDYAGEIKPNSGQWGAGLMYDLTDNLTTGLYVLNYHDKNPSPLFNVSTIRSNPFREGTVLGVVSGLCGTLGLDCSAVENVVTDVVDEVIASVASVYLPYSYNIRYFDDIKLYGASATTTLGPVNVGFEFAYRQGVPMLVDGDLAGITAPQPVRGDTWQVNLSGLYVGGTTAYWDSLNLVVEASLNHVVRHDTLYLYDVDGQPLQDGNGNNINAFRELTGDKTSWGIQGLAEFGYTDVFPGGWDMSVPVVFGIAFGTPAVAGSLGALSGSGDVRVAAGVKFRHLNNLEIGVMYNAFFGSYHRIERPLVDRDYVVATVKYTF